MADLDFVVTHIGHITYRKPNANWAIKDLQNKENYILACSEKGLAYYYIGGKIVAIQPGDILFFKKGEPHTGWSDREDPWTFYSIGFDMDVYNDNTSQYFSHLGTLFQNVNAVQYRGLMENLYKTWLLKQVGYLIKCRSLLMDILQEIIIVEHNANMPPAHVRKIQMALEYIQKHYKTTHRVDVLAKIAGLSPSYFRLLFKKATGYSVNNYQNLLRISYARDMMQSGGYNVTGAALAAGFTDVCYFSRLYKKIIGFPPSSCLHNGVERG